MSAQQSLMIAKLYFEAVDEVLYGAERKKVKIIFCDNIVDLEGPELLAQKVADAVERKLKGGK